MNRFCNRETSTDIMLYGMDTVAGKGVYDILYNFCASKEMAIKLSKKIASEFHEKNYTLINNDDAVEEEDGYIIDDCSISYCTGEEIDVGSFLYSFEESIKEIIQGLEGNDIDEKLNKLFSSRDKDFLDNFLELVVCSPR